MSDFEKMMKALDEWVKDVPTADQVRARFIDYETEVSHCAGWIDGVSNEYGTAFDQWLNEVRAEAWDEGKRGGLRQSDWEHSDTPTMYVAVNPYRQEQAEMNSDLAEAWDKGAETAWNRSTPEVNGARYHWRHEGEPPNPYRKEKDQ